MIRRWWFILGVAAALIAILSALAYKPLTAQTMAMAPTGQPLYMEIGTVYTVTGQSMVPAIESGDWVVITPGKTAPRVNSVVVFWDLLPTNIIVHRVIALGIDDKGWWATTKGDNAPDQDWLYLREVNLLGVVKWRIQVYK